MIVVRMLQKAIKKMVRFRTSTEFTGLGWWIKIGNNHVFGLFKTRTRPPVPVDGIRYAQESLRKRERTIRLISPRSFLINYFNDFQFHRKQNKDLVCGISSLTLWFFLECIVCFAVICGLPTRLGKVSRRSAPLQFSVVQHESTVPLFHH